MRLLPRYWDGQLSTDVACINSYWVWYKSGPGNTNWNQIDTSRCHPSPRHSVATSLSALKAVLGKVRKKPASADIVIRIARTTSTKLFWHRRTLSNFPLFFLYYQKRQQFQKQQRPRRQRQHLHIRLVAGGRDLRTLWNVLKRGPQCTLYQP